MSQRKPRARTPKVEKTNEEGGTKEEVTKGRKRKKPMKEDGQETSDVGAGAGPATGEVDPITATIEAVLANASSIDTPKPKKARRTKKQEGTAKTPNQGANKTADDVDENDDDDSTAGNKEEFSDIVSWRLIETLYQNFNNAFCTFSQTGESNRRRVATEEQVQFPLQHG